MKQVSINNGYYQMKSTDSKMFNSKIKECEFADIQSCDVLTLSGKTYMVGEGKYNINNDKTSTDFSRILILNMLLKFFDRGTCEEAFNIVLSSPPSSYKHQVIQLPLYLKGTYYVTQGSKDYKITINNVKVYPETFIVYLNYVNEYKRKNLLIIDIGGHTTNLCLLKRGMFSSDDFVTLNNGMYHLDNEIAIYLNTKNVEHNISLEDIQYMRDTSNNTFYQEKDSIDGMYDNYVKDLITNLQLKQWNYANYEVLATGGGSLILYKNLCKVFGNIKLSTDCLFDNTKALEKISTRDLRR